MDPSPPRTPATMKTRPTASGQGGNDRLFGASGADSITGGNGADSAKGDEEDTFAEVETLLV